MVVVVCENESRSVLSDSLWPMDYIVCQAPRSVELSRQEYWSGLLFPTPGDLLNPETELTSSISQADSLHSEPWWRWWVVTSNLNTFALRFKEIGESLNVLIPCLLLFWVKLSLFCPHPSDPKEGWVYSLWGNKFRYVHLREIYQFSLVAQSWPTLCHPMNRSMPGLPVHHKLPEFTQTHAHWVNDAIQPSHPLSSPSPPAPNPS